MPVIIIVVVLVSIIIGLTVYNLSVYKKIETFKNINQKIVSLNIIQEFMNIIGQDISSEKKMEKLNDILIEKYQIQYSSIVVFDGGKYVMLASNVDKKHWDTLTNLSTEEIFSESITTANIKYITSEKPSETLPYQKMELERAKSAMFLPLYIDNVYIGYWLIESEKAHAFDELDSTILEAVKQNIVSIIKGVEYQNIIEGTVSEDKFSGLYYREYLFGEGKKILNQNAASTICMLSIINLPEINKRYGREKRNNAVTMLSQEIKKDLSEKYIFVRYFGPKFIIAFPGVDIESVITFLEDIKSNVEKVSILDEEQKAEIGKKKVKKEAVNMKLNLVAATYYKGTGIEGVTNNLEKYIDTANPEESDINII